ncbi:caskin-2-like isoform X1 [Mytilus californianus]|uniref:caskin-2-like isoform X1 n=2 Tax=Mytilus californianus TaxID=6549 RepID=UPI002246E460|nr:caskin-2-like isoform X1 [Mytilus californianus]
MGKDQDFLQAVKDRDISHLQKLLAKAGKHGKTKLLGSSKRINIDYQDSDGMSALHQAALVGSLEMMGMLIEQGASVGLSDNKGMLALHYACWQGKAEPVHMLLQWRSPVSNQSYDGATPLHLACQHGHFDVANLLLLHNAVPAILNHENKTPLDLACEFGRYRVVDLLLRSNLCASLLFETPLDMVDGNTTCIHLAAKNGHVEILRLLLQAGMDINRLTQQGTCLHQAALCGKVDVAKLLLDCGVDVNRTNSHGETALDIVLKYTPCRAAKDLKQLLTEASFAVQARAIKDYFNVYDPQSLTFKEGDIIRVLEQSEGLWKGCVITDGRTAKAGYFPPDHVVLIDKSAMMSSYSPGKKVGMPQVPDVISRNQHVFSSEDGFPPPPPSVFFPPERDHDVRYISPHYSSYENLNGRVPQYNGEDRSPVPYHLVNDMKTANSISPTNSNRNSAASSDSGRGYSTGHTEPRSPHNYVNVQIVNQHRLSGQSYESGVSSRQSYHSNSSSSVGSLDRLEESGPISNINVAELFHSGMQDHEILKTWLRDLRYEEYFGLFINAGYDMRTISRMTPEDLTAIGITKPGHRKRLKAEIARLNISDGLPDYKPNTVEDWLHLLHLEQYCKTLTSQGYADIDSVTDISWEDLEEIGISKLGHQKKIMLAVDRLKRIVSNAKRQSTLDGKRGSAEILDPPHNNISNRHSGEAMYNHRPRKSSSGESLNNSEQMYNSSPARQRGSDGSLDSCFFPNSPTTKAFQPDVVAIQVKRNQSSPNSSLTKDMAGQTITYQSFQGPSRRSNEFDRDSTPTEEIDNGYRAPLPMAPIVPKVMNKPKPVAKIVAKAKRSSKEYSPDFVEAEKLTEYLEDHIEKSVTTGNGGFKRQKSDLGSETVYDSPKHSPYNSGLNNSMSQSCPPGVSGPLHSSTPIKKVPPPPPPKRSNSISKQSQLEYSIQKSLENSPYAASVPNTGNNSPNIVDSYYVQNSNRNSGGNSQNNVNSCKVPPVSVSSTSGNFQYAGSIPKSAVPKLQPKPVISTKPAVSPKPKKSVKVASEQNSFASCVQSLSQKFGSKCGEVISPDDMVNSDGEDFPPPPPPIAMDIITPKLHNYGIPSKEDMHGEEYRLQYQRQVSANSVQGTETRTSTCSAVQSMRSNQGHESVANMSDNHSVHNNSFSSPILRSTSLRTSPTKEPPILSHMTKDSHVGSHVPVSSHNQNQNTSSFRRYNGSLSDSTTTMRSEENVVKHLKSVGSPQIKPKPRREYLIKENHVPVGGREKTPPYGTLKRNDSTSSHDSNISTSSVESNTLPFANENVGTIKQRAPPSKTSIVQINEGENDLNPSLFTQRSETMTASLQKRDVIHEQTGSNGLDKNSEDVLTDIDFMLQGLTDELDAMLEDEAICNG